MSERKPDKCLADADDAKVLAVNRDSVREEEVVENRDVRETLKNRGEKTRISHVHQPSSNPIKRPFVVQNPPKKGDLGGWKGTSGAKNLARRFFVVRPGIKWRLERRLRHHRLGDVVVARLRSSRKTHF